MQSISVETDKLYKKLKKYFNSLDSAAVAFSGGGDSALLLYIASLTPGLKLKAYTIKNIMIPENEIRSAKLFTEKYSIDHHIIDIDILSYDQVSSNLSDRCYHCKKIIFKKIIHEASILGINTVIEGTHAGDATDFRPGRKAVRELGVLSPLEATGFKKENINELSAFLSLDTCGKDSQPCLATRIPMGISITPELLKKAEAAEIILRSFGFRQVRARIHGDILRIEVAENMLQDIVAPEIRKSLYDELRNEGFSFITLDILGYRTGSMNVESGEPFGRK